MDSFSGSRYNGAARFLSIHSESPPGVTMERPVQHFERIALVGNLTVDALRAELRAVEDNINRSSKPVALVIDLLQMTGYEPPCRSTFADWYKQHSKKISCVAGITTKSGWRIIIAALGLATGGKYQSFATEKEAIDWVTPIDRH